ncbi:MAG: sigma-70 family RNA polymerase sigma factor [Deltaproteobacteria bacterium]|nr:sigma-70 family RNA polymerase sigma factor [Deltaproteobacteria bacterium]
MSERHKGSDPASWVERYGDALYRFAVVRVHRRDIAEDLVQEALLAAFRDRQRFEGSSSEKTWLVGILKHKIADHFRRVSAEAAAALAERGGDAAEEPFDRAGAWCLAPITWPRDPEAELGERELFELVGGCLAELPPGLAAAFTLREIDGMSSDEACKILGISATNLWVRLHRARLRLRQCLEARWFGRGARSERG